MDPLDSLLIRFEREYLEPNSITPLRRDEQLRLLRRFAADLPHSLDQLTAQDVVTFVGEDLKRGIHPNTARKYLGMVRSFVTWADQAGLIEPARRQQLKSVSNPRGSSTRTRPRPYKVSEIATFRAVMAEKYPVLPIYGKGSRAMMSFMRGRVHRLQRHLWRHARRLQFEAQVALALEQGLRRSEIHGLSIPAMHYDNDQIVVLTAKQGPGSQLKRAIPYTTHARTCVQDWLDFRSLVRPDHDCPWLMLDYTGPLDQQLRPLTLKAMGESLSVFGDYTWHRFRHTCATEWLRSGVKLEKVRIYMGHSSLDQTLAYAQILGADIDNAFGEAEADFAKRLGLAA